MKNLPTMESIAGTYELKEKGVFHGYLVILTGGSS